MTNNLKNALSVNAKKSQTKGRVRIILALFFFFVKLIQKEGYYIDDGTRKEMELVLLNSTRKRT
ncbi:hypothetical protein QB910_000108 [Dabrowskivirus KKP3916]|uniref:Uncharacterized protein n=1 Tax=Alicyclobacillus phage KKP_3916 TaxID=3040651 RepID=A0AAT9V818_9CAUD|nr:hypothetical protein QB910_000108 [Alicyclobacillus phage KKP 3916]